MNIIAQFFGLLALFVVFLSYQQKEKKNFLFAQIFSNIFFATQYLLLGGISAFASNIISLGRCVTFYNYEKREKKIPFYVLLIFIISIVSVGIIFYDGAISLIPILIACIYAFGSWHDNLRFTYTVGIFVCLLWIYYNFTVGAYVSIFGSLFELISSAMGLYKLCKKDRVLA